MEVDIKLSGFVHTLGDWMGLPDPFYVLLYIAVIIILLLVLLFILCYSINTIYVIIFLLLAILIISSIIILYYWIGVEYDDIPLLGETVKFLNGTNSTSQAGFLSPFRSFHSIPIVVATPRSESTENTTAQGVIDLWTSTQKIPIARIINRLNSSAQVTVHNNNVLIVRHHH